LKEPNWGGKSQGKPEAAKVHEITRGGEFLESQTGLTEQGTRRKKLSILGEGLLEHAQGINRSSGRERELAPVS